MCKFRPFNKHILVEKFAKKSEQTTTGVLIPDGAKIKGDSRYGLVKFVCAATDCERFLLNLNTNQTPWTTQTGTMDDVFVESARSKGGASLVVDKSMVEEVKIDGKGFSIVHQNYVVGVIDE